MRRNPEAFVSPAEAAAAKTALERSKVRTPQEVLDAFAPLPIDFAGQRLRPLSLASFVVLERLDSPFADDQLSAGTLAEIKAEDMALVAYVLTRDPVDVLDLIAQGRHAVDRAVLTFVADIPAEQIRQLGEAIGRIIVRAFATVVGGGGAQKKTTTRSPACTPPPATGSAGG